MYRVGIIQNESEAIRSGYANVQRNLLKIGLPTDYSLELINVVNIDKLFLPGDDLFILNFDSLFVTTNATSDFHVREVLETNKDAIADFLQRGRGLFVSSQKKLGVAEESNPQGGRTRFLPEQFDFQTIQRPKNEKDSGEGLLELANSDNLLLRYPNTITETETRNHCCNNGFRRHMYRSMIRPVTQGVYEPLIVDRSYNNTKEERWLLVTNTVSQYGERIVVSTIAIDWEMHNHLLENIILYITEGIPKIAFVNTGTKTHDDFDYLMSSAKLSKVTFRVYNSIEEVENQPLNIHSTYIFSPGYSRSVVEDFVKRAESIEANLPSKKYMRVYFFEKFKDTTALVQYSNFSTFDVLTDNATLWIKSKYCGKMWDNSFWTTYEILSMMLASKVDMCSYVSGVLKDIKKHYTDYSYDNVAGATCGMFELLLALSHNHAEELKDENFDNKQLQGIGKWLVARSSTLSNYDLQTFASIIVRYKQELSNISFCVDRDFWEAILQRLNERGGIVLEDITEQEVCRSIELCIILDEEQSIANYLSILHKKQDSDGKWTNVRRTASVLVFLLSNIKCFQKVYQLDDMLYNGISYLYSSYSKQFSNWDNDIQTTAQAIHAINLYNSIFYYSTQDFLSTLGLESDKVYAASVVRNVSNSMNRLRDEINLSSKTIVILKSQIEEQKMNIDDLENEKSKWQENTEIEHHNAKVYRTASVAWGALFFAVIVYLAVHYPMRILQELIHIDIIGIVGGFVFGLAATFLINGKYVIKKNK